MERDKGLIEKLLRDRESFYDNIFAEKSIGGTIVKLLGMSILFFAIYGFVMGLYNSPLQALSSTVKVPILFLLSLVICYPAMFVFNILLGSKLNLGQSLSMILSAYALTSCVLVSFAPIALFFMLIGSSYAFLRLLHVAIFAVSGIAGMVALSAGLKYGCEKHSVYPRQGVQVFKIWVLIFAFVGTQLAWNMRPFIGNRSEPFQLFRKLESNFYAHIIHTTGEFLFGGGKNSGQKSTGTSLDKGNDSDKPDSTILMSPVQFSHDSQNGR